MSKLIVEVCKIDKIEEHPNADRLEIATIKGWNCVIQKEQYKEGDLCVFIPTDAIVPEILIDKHKLEFLRKNGRVKTIKLRKVISQGLVLPIDILPKTTKIKEGTSVIKELGITKYEAPTANYQKREKETIKKYFIKYKENKISLRRLVFKSGGLLKDKLFKKKKNKNPLFDKYTDIENIKNYNLIFTKEDIVVITEKIHGTNFRAGNVKRDMNNLWQRLLGRFFGEYEFVYGSRNVQLKFGSKTWYGEDVYGKIAEKYNLAEVIPKDYIIYGEIYGKKIQELEYGLDDIDLVIFDIKYKNKYMDWEDVVDFCKGRNIPSVPVCYIGEYSPEVVKQYTEAKNTILKCSKFKNFPIKQIREGCVVKPVVESMNNRLGRKILKSINPEYLLTKKRTEFH